MARGPRLRQARRVPPATTTADRATAAAPLDDTAVVVGGSLAGLVAARVLADRFRRVLVVERDAFPAAPGSRKGVPQGRHVHVLLKAGEQVLERRFPGILDELGRRGATRVDLAAENRWYHYGGWKVRFPSGITYSCQSRPLLEWAVLERVRALANVTLLEGRSAAGLSMARGARRVRGLRLAAADGTAPEDVAAELVVDASGRGSRMPAWLAEHGLPAPAETTVAVDVGYASRPYRRPAGARHDWLSLLVYPTPPARNLGVVVPIEDDAWMVTLVGWFGEHPGGDEEGFRDFCRRLPSPELWEAIRDAEPLGPIAVHKFPSNRRRHYERLAMPEGVVVLGDALCSFNPIYGQGMTTAALAADTLGDVLAAERAPLAAAPGLARRCQRALARVIDMPWLLTTTEDLRSPAAAGTRPLWVPLVNWYTARLHAQSRTDPDVFRRFLRVMHLLDPPTALFRPPALARILLGGLVPTKGAVRWASG